MNLKPSQTSLAQGFCFPEDEQTATEIIAEMVQVWWDGVRTATKIKVVRQIKRVPQELFD
jgi:hypothetical protein